MEFYHHSTLIGWYHISITNNTVTVSKGEKYGYSRAYRPILEETHPTTEKAFARFQELIAKAADNEL